MSGMGEGITLLKVAEDGTLVDHGLAIAADSPSYLTRAGDMIYAVGEAGPSVSAFRIQGDELRFNGTQDAAGPQPCAVAVLGSRRLLVAACYGNGTIDVHPLSPEGAIQKTGQSLRGEGKGSRINQDGPHAHAVLQVSEAVVLTADLGTDSVYIHSFDGELLTRTGTVSLPTGSGPRDLLLHPSGAVWVLTEFSHEIFVLDGDDFSIVDSIALPGAEENDNSAAMALSADGRFGYAGLRGSDTVSVFSVSDDGRTLAPVGSVGCGGGWPRHLVIDGQWLRVANQLTNSVVTFSVGADGIPVKHSQLFVPSPTYLLLD
jgi:6-phosphogluconolactonase (cycloisomerase 2 family)